MLIGELVKKTGLSRDTIRFYEKKGLISFNKISRRDNNYKEYSAQILDRLNLIRRLKDLGFTLNEIETFMDLWREHDASCRNLKYTLESKILTVNEQLLKLTELKSRLSEAVIKCNNSDCEFETTVPPCL